MHPDYTPKDIKRFWSKVAVAGPDDCWEWQAGKDPDGYGTMSIGGRTGKMIRAHRLAYEFCISLIPDGLDVLHSCDNPPCCNPAHLWLGTRGENNRDAKMKGHTKKGNAGICGEKHYNHKLTESEVKAIRIRYAQADISQRQLAEEYNISRAEVGCIVRGKRWSHLL